MQLTETLVAGQGARDYIWLRGSGILRCLFATCFRKALFGQSESRVPFLGSVSGLLANVALDAFFILKFSWGV